MAKLNINGRMHDVQVEGDTPLLWVIREQIGLTGTKYGCGVAQCGACTVHVDGVAARSCQLPVGALAGKRITTLEGLGTDDKPHPVQAAFIAEQAVQCGYCTNGMIMESAAFLAQTPKPTEAQVREALANNICRCGTQPRVMRAVLRAAAQA
jgi:aerobic-type carbon monoxide dehydrogenase small subunit (CoxS/CutS family)